MSNALNDERILPFPILIADLGGTNARFAILVDAYAEPKVFPTIKAAEYPSIDAAIQAHVLDRTSLMPKAAVIAVAGPTDGEEVDLTNNDWVVRPKVLLEKFGMEEIVVLNDYEAQALAVIALESDQLKKIGGGEIDENANRLVIGPGTGLGVAGLVHAAHTWIPVAGEGGHMDLGPRNEKEADVFANLERIEGRISGEQVLCGRGMVNLYNAISAAGGGKNKLTKPEDVTEAAGGGNDPVATETIGMFCEILGRVAGDLALVFMARGGVYLSGGITLKILPMFDAQRFRRGFEDKAPHSDAMKSIASFAILHEQAPMLGLAAYARTPQRFGVMLEGRRWSRG